jgi:hypothetical protein
MDRFITHSHPSAVVTQTIVGFLLSAQYSKFKVQEGFGEKMYAHTATMMTAIRTAAYQ